ncbi:ATP synthase subunit s, mitochondrial [Elysia marginata]|uniref:ATP synthase subunit s, mitochondrial n=1 Tax=Elysia marginata TaxID=1093978 RepID=A0AAV4GSA2_9GAST|nr:ATP synthase subunit s, mitochondrial [Elysia marginata]
MFRKILPQTYARKVLISAKTSQCGSHQYCVWRYHHGVSQYRLASSLKLTTLKNMFNRPQELILNQKRCFWGVDVAFNRVDEERVRLAGPDRAAAEWVLRNGGAIKWTTSSNHLNDYNFLPTTQFENYKLEEIDLTATDVIGIGFEHLKDLQHVKKIKISGVKTMGDDGLSHLHNVKDTLTTLEISHCPMVTEKGLEHLVSLKKLKTLVLYDLMEIRNIDAAAAKLHLNMPGVNIVTENPELHEHKEEKQ